MISGLIIAAVLWYALRGVARVWPPARGLVVRLSRHTRRLHAWVLSAPATFAYTTVFLASTIIQKNSPKRLIDLITSSSSTNLLRLGRDPVRALTESMLWVADKGDALTFYFVLFATVVAYAERRFGTPRLVLICLTGHVLGSLATAEVERWAIDSGRAPETLATTTDVGVSYIMIAGLAAGVVAMSGRWRTVCGVVLAASVLLPLAVTHTIWDLGHVMATGFGLCAALLLRWAAPLRRPPDLTACLRVVEA